MGGAKGGQARAAALTAKRRSAIAMKAAKARDKKAGSEAARVQREYELNHND
jgi:hypothetical protein